MFELFGFFLKLLRLLLKVTKVTTGQHSKLSAEGRSPPQELEVGPRIFYLI